MTTKLLSKLVLAALIGGALGVIFAPKSGIDTRKQIKSGLDRVAKTTLDGLNVK